MGASAEKMGRAGVSRRLGSAGTSDQTPFRFLHMALAFPSVVARSREEAEQESRFGCQVYKIALPGLYHKVTAVLPPGSLSAAPEGDQVL